MPLDEATLRMSEMMSVIIAFHHMLVATAVRAIIEDQEQPCENESPSDNQPADDYIRDIIPSDK